MPMLRIIDLNVVKLDDGGIVKAFHEATGLYIVGTRPLQDGLTVVLETKEEHDLAQRPEVREKLERTNGLRMVKSPEYRAACSLFANYVQWNTMHIPLEELKELINYYNDCKAEKVIQVQDMKLKIEFVSPDEADRIKNSTYGIRLPSIDETWPTWTLEKEMFFKLDQCRKCFSYHHETPDCEKEEQFCYKCSAAGHKGEECTNPDEVKCLNCGGDHVAIAFKCIVRRELIRDRVRQVRQEEELEILRSIEESVAASAAPSHECYGAVGLPLPEPRSEVSEEFLAERFNSNLPAWSRDNTNSIYCDQSIIARSLPLWVTSQYSETELEKEIAWYNSVDTTLAITLSNRAMNFIFKTAADADQIMSQEYGIDLKPPLNIPHSHLVRDRGLSVPQCQRCHSFEHSTESCEETEAICFFCGGKGHESDDCTRKYSPVCINCKEDHCAKAFRCPVRMVKLHEKEEEQGFPPYVPPRPLSPASREARRIRRSFRPNVLDHVLNSEHPIDDSEDETDEEEEESEEDDSELNSSDIDVTMSRVQGHPHNVNLFVQTNNADIPLSEEQEQTNNANLLLSEEQEQTHNADMPLSEEQEDSASEISLSGESEDEEGSEEPLQRMYYTPVLDAEVEEYHIREEGRNRINQQIHEVPQAFIVVERQSENHESSAESEESEDSDGDDIPLGLYVRRRVVLVS